MNNIKVTLNRAGITAVGGTIGGWTLNASQIYSGTVMLNSGGSIINGNKWRLHADGSGQLASGTLTWDSAGNVSVTGTINAKAGKIGGFTIAEDRIGSVAVGTGTTGGGLSIYDNLLRVGNTVSYVMFGDNTYPSTLGVPALRDVSSIKKTIPIIGITECIWMFRGGT